MQCFLSKAFQSCVFLFFFAFYFFQNRSSNFSRWEIFCLYKHFFFQKCIGLLFYFLIEAKCSLQMDDVCNIAGHLWEIWGSNTLSWLTVWDKQMKATHLRHRKCFKKCGDDFCKNFLEFSAFPDPSHFPLANRNWKNFLQFWEVLCFFYFRENIISRKFWKFSLGYFFITDIKLSVPEI